MHTQQDGQRPARSCDRRFGVAAVFVAVIDVGRCQVPYEDPLATSARLAEACR